MRLQVGKYGIQKRKKYSCCAQNKTNWWLLVRSGSEETVDTVVAVSVAKKQQHTEAENR